jgi:prepilin-type N-terminal cleavage/methylation domain-containing protein
MNKKYGFTLLEMMIAIVLMTGGLAALLMSFNRGMFAFNDGSELRTATALAQGKMEEVRNTAFASIADEARAAVSGFSGFDREVDVTASPGGTDANFKQADVIVYRTTKGGEISTTLTTYFVNKAH